jgi:GPH family glycoside/pentoside/hexuronide:cation symporter
LSDTIDIKDFRETGSKSRKALIKGIYGLSRLGSSMLLDLVTILVFFVYIKLYGLNPLLDGIGNALGKVAIAISGVLMGYVSDRFPSSRIGRRKPFLIVGAPMLGIAFIMLFIPLVVFSGAPDQGGLFGWMTIWVVMFNFAYGFLLVPYQSMMPETFNEKDRFGASLSENVFSFLGTLVGFVVITDLSVTNFEAGGFTETVVILGVIAILFYIPAIFLIPVSAEDMARAKAAREVKKAGTPMEKQPHDSLGTAIRRDFALVVHNKNYVRYVFFIGVAETGIFMSISALAGYVEDVLDFSADDFIVIGATFGLVSVVSIVIWWWMSQKRYNIHKTLIAGYILTILTMPFSLVIGLSQEFVLLQGALFLGALLAGMECDYFLQYVMLGNIVEEDTRRNGHSRSGSFHGMLDGPENAFQGLGYVILGLIMSLPKVTVGAKIFSAGYYWWGPVAAVFLVLGLLIFRNIKADLGDIVEYNKSGGLATSISLFSNRHPELKGFHGGLARVKDFLVDIGKFVKFLFTNDPERPVERKGKKIK